MSEAARDLLVRPRRLVSPPAQHFARVSAARIAALRTALDRACAADALARLQETIGGVIGLVALGLALALAPGCGVADHRDERGSASVFQELRTDIVRPAERPAPVDPASWSWPTQGARRAQLEVDGFGTIELELYPALAPRTVANFEQLAAQGFYDGTTFHRVIPGFMIQGGDPNSRDTNPRNDGKGGPESNVPDEFSAAPHVRGVVSMANRGAPDSGGSQFFIMLDDRQDLDGAYSVFGRVVSGMDVVDAIAQVETDRTGRWGPRDRPIGNVVIASARAGSAAAAEPAPAATE